ncbi:MAG TPA: dockerin type I domain-containing protein, partial [Ktedonobacteraceae bacterium]|nr:dockerin type I domain-containing protein [Ktedonobacteraceae bacterium]
NQSITLVAGTTSIVSFNWPTPSLARGVYILRANATKVLGETNMANNFFTAASSFIVRFHGDVNGDCRVDIVDLATVGSTFGKVAGQPGYNTNADLNNDGLINIVDLVIVAGNFGQNC